MELLNSALNFYDECLQKADKRVANWFLMDSYAPTWILSTLYLVAVKICLRVMEHRKPFQLRWTIFFYNTFLVSLNLYIFLELFTATWRRNYSYFCQPVNYSDDPDELRIASALWWYYFSKCIEFMDTFFFVLRRKNSQVSFLHVYHHATMFPIWWIGVKWVPGGQSFFGAQLNSGIHVIMYTYYAISALGPAYHRYLWWKKYLTTIQMIQFTLGVGHSVQSLYFGCDFPSWMQWALIFYGSSIFLLFLNFYLHAYGPSQRSRKPEQNGHAKTMPNPDGDHPQPHSNGLSAPPDSPNCADVRRRLKTHPNGVTLTNGVTSNGHVTNE